MFRKLTLAAALASATLVAPAVFAQDNSTSAPDDSTMDFHHNGAFRGFRAEAQANRDWFHSEGAKDGSWNVGGAIGFDGQIGRIVIGPEVSYTRTRNENITAATGGTVAHKSFNEIDASLRAGYLVTPKILVYGIGGYASDEQRKAFIPASSSIVGYDNHDHVDGYQYGAGAEYDITNMFYVGAGYRHANFDDHTHRDRVFLSAGVRFKS